jgi:diguanylate cyclase (GGDEF)-like protein/PAS domain S-box-containing protein
MKSTSRLSTPLLEAFPAPELDEGQLSRELLASCGEGIVAYDRELRHVAWNPFMEELTGRPAADVLGRTAAEVFPHLGDQGVAPLLQRALSGETVTSHDISWPVPPSGESRWVSGTFAPHRDAAGSIRGVVGVLRDVTGRRQTEKALLSVAPEFRCLVEQSLVGVYLIQDGRYRYVNPKLGAIFGYTQQELLALDSVLELVVEEDRPTVLGALQRWIEGERQPIRYSFGATRKDGDPIEVEVYGTATEFEGRPAAIGTLVDVTHRKRSEAQISEQAYNDPLTKLPNLVRFTERLQLELAQAKRHRRKLAVVYLDLDSFKFVNDSWGHAIGDRLLQSLALRLKRRLRQCDAVARIGGDEFVILMPEVRQADDMSGIAQKLLSIVRHPFKLDERTIQVSGSVGIATYPEDGEDADTLLRNADAAVNRAKDLGRNTFQLCTPELTARAVERLALQNGLQLALEQSEFVLHYQPLVSLVSGRIVGFEALVRWQHPQKGLVMPGAFIPVAEETGLILSLGEWVLYEACRQLKAWHRTGLTDLRIAVNFSARQFQERHLAHTVARALSDAGLDPRHLEVEITESVAMEEAEVVVANLNLLRSMGVGIAIDDFGTGYSSMSYLKRYPVTSLKIDRSFVMDLPDNPADAGIVRAIVEMAHGSRLSVTAEGVETKDQFLRLQECGCDEMQGYWVSRPMTPTAVDRHLADEIELWSQKA